MTTNEVPTATFAPGTVVQYKKIGKARLVKPVDLWREDGSGYWTVEFLTGPKTYRQDALGGKSFPIHSGTATVVA